MIRDQLPKVGTETDGKVHLGDGETTYAFGVRPNYHEIKKQKYNSEETLVGVLLGLALPSVIGSVCIEMMNHIKRKEDVIFPLDQQYGYFFELLSIIKEIRKTIDIGIATGEVKKADLHPRTEENLIDPRSKCTIKIKRTCGFSEAIYFDTLSFLDWMQNKHLIPPELAFYKNDIGELQWKEGVTEKNTAKPDIDYSKKNKSDLRLLVNRWIDEEGITRKQVVMRLYEDDLNNGTPMTTLLSRVDRLRGVKTS
jgi:hypothetical protein